MTVRDLRYALGSIRRNPLMAVATILTLILGIGLNVSVFTILDGILFRARVEKDPGSFVHLSPSYSGISVQREAPWFLSTRDYKTFASQARSVRQLAAWNTARVTVEQVGSDPLLALLVTCNFFDVYGLDHMKMGRVFGPAECSTPGSAPVAVISEELWRNQFASDAGIVGKPVHVNRKVFNVIGVVPEAFSGRVRGPGVWIPWTMRPVLFPRRDGFRDQSLRWLTVEGRLAPGFTRAGAQSELQVIAARLDRLEAGRQTSMVVTNGSIYEEPSLRSILFWIGPMVMGGLTLILLITCTNVAILQLSRAAARQREMGIRLALGAGKWRLTAMLLTETLLLAAIAGVACAGVAWEAPLIFARTLGSPSTPIFSLKPDLTVLLYLGAAVFMSTCLAGLSPAAECLRVNLAAAMKTGDSSSGSGRGSSRRHDYLVTVQTAMCVVLLVAAGLFMRTQYTMFQADPGFETKHVVFVPMREGTNMAAAEQLLLGPLRSVPSVLSVAAGTPFATGELGIEMTTIRIPRAGGETKDSAAISSVSPDFFETLSVAILRGRRFAAEREVVVSDALAKSFWPGEDPLGRTLILEDGSSVSVAGVAADLKIEHLGSPDAPHIYRSRTPHTQPDALLVRFAGSPEPVQAGVREALKQVDAERLVPVKTLRGILDESAEQVGTIVRMACMLAAIALSLAVLGIYGVVALAVSRRKRELGVRMALGATKRLIVRAVLLSGLRPIVFGLGSGLVLAALAARAIMIAFQRTSLPINGADPLIYAAAGFILVIVAIMAMIAPALRAAGADPMQALRQE